MRGREEREGKREREKRERRGDWGKNCRGVRENLDAKGSVEKKRKSSTAEKNLFESPSEPSTTYGLLPVYAAS